MASFLPVKLRNGREIILVSKV